MKTKQTRVRKVPIKTLDELLKRRSDFMDDYSTAMADKLQQNRTRKIKIKSIKPHTNFQDEIYQQKKTDKFLDRAFYIGCAILVVLAITYIILK